MIPHRPPAGTATAWSPPPYRELHPLPRHGAPGRAALPRAALLVLDVVPGADADAGLQATVHAARARFPAAPLILRVPQLNAPAIRLAQRAAHLRVRAVLGRDEPLADTLRPILTRPDDLGDDVVEWLALRGCPLAPGPAAIIRQVVDQARGRGLPPRATAESGRTVRHRLRVHGLPPPSAWHQMARALRAAMRIQAQPDAALAVLALELGYADRSGLAWQLTRMFGVTPVAIRGTLGWEWLLDRWLGARRPGTGDDASGKVDPLQTLSDKESNTTL